MKKVLLLAYAFFMIFAVQSCSINSDITYHKDSATSTLMDIDMKEFISMMKSQGSAEQMKNLEKFPKEWTSFYDMEIKDGKKPSTNPDSIRLMKKMFVKSNYTISEFSGLSIRMDHFTKDDQKMLLESAKNSRKKDIPFNADFNDWDGKKLILNTDKFNLEEMKKGMEKGDGDQEMSAEQADETIKMMLKQYKFNLKFENNIKTITGKHDWVKQTGPKTVEVAFDMANLDQKTKLTNSDKQIVIVTE